MPRTRTPYPAAFREQIVALAARAGALRTQPGSSSRVRRRPMAGSSRPIVTAVALAALIAFWVCTILDLGGSVDRSPGEGG